MNKSAKCQLELLSHDLTKKEKKKRRERINNKYV